MCRLRTESTGVCEIDRIVVGVAVAVVENEFANSTIDRIPVGIAVAIVEDEFANSINNRTDCDRIRQVCEKYKSDVRLVLARDEIESWLLADMGFWGWLNENKTQPRNCDNMERPSLYLQG